MTNLCIEDYADSYGEAYYEKLSRYKRPDSFLTLDTDNTTEEDNGAVEVSPEFSYKFEPICPAAKIFINPSSDSVSR